MLALNLLCSSQNITKFEFVGTITVTDGDVMSYKVVFNQGHNNEISGYSITDYYGKNSTQTSIVGKYDTINNVLIFNELANIKTKADVTNSTFCYISTEKLKIRNVKGNKIITGGFKGLFPSGDLCAEGLIYLVESSFVKKIKSMTDTIKMNQDSMIISKDSIKVLNAQQNLKIKSNDKLLNEFLGNDIFIEIWDGEVEDNDMISIYLNDEIFKEKIRLKSKKLNITLPNTADTFKLKIVALNEGYSGINTVNFAVNDAHGTKEFTSNLKKGEFFDMEFRKSK